MSVMHMLSQSCVALGILYTGIYTASDDAGNRQMSVMHMLSLSCVALGILYIHVCAKKKCHQVHVCECIIIPDYITYIGIVIYIAMYGYSCLGYNGLLQQTGCRCSRGPYGLPSYVVDGIFCRLLIALQWRGLGDGFHLLLATTPASWSRRWLCMDERQFIRNKISRFYLVFIRPFCLQTATTGLGDKRAK